MSLLNRPMGQALIDELAKWRRGEAPSPSPSPSPSPRRPSERAAALSAEHEEWRARIRETTQVLRDNPHRVRGIEGHFRDSRFVPGVSRRDAAFKPPEPLA